MGPGGFCGLQNRLRGANYVLGGFDSYTLPPKKIPSIDKKIFVSRWFLFCPKVLYLRRFGLFLFCLVAIFGVFRRFFSEDTWLELAFDADYFNDFKANR